MRRSLQIVAVALVAFQPLSACFSQEMSISEHECCQQMMGDCGRVSMPSSHSCCKYVDHSSTARVEARKALEKNHLSFALAPTLELRVSTPLSLPFAQDAPESPPHSPPTSLQILRI